MVKSWFNRILPSFARAHKKDEKKVQCLRVYGKAARIVRRLSMVQTLSQTYMSA